MRPSMLRLLQPGDELSGVASPALERAARTCALGDATHRGVVHLASELARHALRACAPPSAHADMLAPLAVAEEWLAGRADEHAVRRARSEAFAAALGVERRTVEAVRGLVAATVRAKVTPLDDHADRVVVRHAGLAAAHACGAALLALDAVSTPAEAMLGPQQVAGALAYRSTALGIARSPQLRERACELAEWELGRQGTSPEHGTGALAIQLFHEFLGARWKDVSDGERLALLELADWALGGRIAR